MSKKQKTKTSKPEFCSHSVCMEFIHPQASEVCIAGSFNDWHPNATPMISRGGDKWAKELALPPGRYEYRFVVDGQWVDDPAAKETVSNPFGGLNAVLTVANITNWAHRF
jgi:1,4-alpha-glucan branching enzyme